MKIVLCILAYTSLTYATFGKNEYYSNIRNGHNKLRQGVVVQRGTLNLQKQSLSGSAEQYGPNLPIRDRYRGRTRQPGHRTLHNGGHISDHGHNQIKFVKILVDNDRPGDSNFGANDNLNQNLEFNLGSTPLQSMDIPFGDSTFNPGPFNVPNSVYENVNFDQTHTATGAHDQAALFQPQSTDSVSTPLSINPTLYTDHTVNRAPALNTRPILNDAPTLDQGSRINVGQTTGLLQPVHVDPRGNVGPYRNVGLPQNEVLHQYVDPHQYVGPQQNVGPYQNVGPHANVGSDPTLGPHQNVGSYEYVDLQVNEISQGNPNPYTNAGQHVNVGPYVNVDSYGNAQPTANTGPFVNVAPHFQINRPMYVSPPVSAGQPVNAVPPVNLGPSALALDLLPPYDTTSPAFTGPDRETTAHENISPNVNFNLHPPIYVTPTANAAPTAEVIPRVTYAEAMGFDSTMNIRSGASASPTLQVTPSGNFASPFDVTAAVNAVPTTQVAQHLNYPAAINLSPVVYLPPTKKIAPSSNSAIAYTITPARQVASSVNAASPVNLASTFFLGSNFCPDYGENSNPIQHTAINTVSLAPRERQIKFFKLIHTNRNPYHYGKNYS